MATLSQLADDGTVFERALDHLENGTTDVPDGMWQESTDHYRSPGRDADGSRELYPFRRRKNGSGLSARWTIEHGGQEAIGLFHRQLAAVIGCADG